jgi:hypothetical protein
VSAPLFFSTLGLTLTIGLSDDVHSACLIPSCFSPIQIFQSFATVLQFLLVSPSSAAFACWLAFSFSWIPACPGTQVLLLSVDLVHHSHHLGAVDFPHLIQGCEATQRIAQPLRLNCVSCYRDSCVSCFDLSIRDWKRSWLSNHLVFTWDELQLSPPILIRPCIFGCNPGSLRLGFLPIPTRLLFWVCSILWEELALLCQYWPPCLWSMSCIPVGPAWSRLLWLWRRKG